MWANHDPAHAGRLSDQGLSFGPPPAWMLEREIPQTSREAQGALHYPLSDTQIDLTGNRAWSYRLVQRALNADGVGRAAHFSVSFDPSFESVTIHRVRVIRDNQAIELALPEAFQLLRRETNLERRLYDGRYTADMQIPDLRPGDVLDTWYTTFGSNPALKDAFDARFSFEWSEPVEHTAVRIRAPESRPLSIRLEPKSWQAPNYTETRAGEGLIDREWSDKRGSVFRYDDSTPEWWIGHCRLSIADTTTWTDIADLFRSAYAPPAELPPSLATEVERIAQGWPKAADRIVQALRFVQRELRYLSVSIGDGGFVPRAIEDIWSRRFGDCKDVSRLLATMLRRLGVDATPSLVHTRAGASLGDGLPSVYAFNHCITRVCEGGKTYWLDATLHEQGGDLDRLDQADFCWALPLGPNAKLERMVLGGFKPDILDVTEKFTFGQKADSPAQLSVTSRYRSWRADSMRSAIRREGIARLAEGWQKHYAQGYGGATAVTPPAVTDDLDANVLTVVEQYRLDKPWTSAENGLVRFHSIDDIFRRDLNVLPYSGRTQPLFLGSKRKLTRQTLFKMPKTWSCTPWNDEFDTRGLRASTSLRVSENQLMQHDCSYEITEEMIEGPDLDAFRENIEAFYGGVSVNLQHPVKDNGFVNARSGDGPSWPQIAFGVFILILIGIRVILSMTGG